MFVGCALFSNHKMLVRTNEHYTVEKRDSIFRIQWGREKLNFHLHQKWMYLCIRRCLYTNRLVYLLCLMRINIEFYNQNVNTHTMFTFANWQTNIKLKQGSASYESEIR